MCIVAEYLVDTYLTFFVLAHVLKAPSSAYYNHHHSFLLRISKKITL